MKKTISINISGVIFHIEEDGYEKLKTYLSSIQTYFSTYADSQEIVTDIENRIAEKLLKSLKGGQNGDDKAPARQAVTLEDINGLMARMGTVADFEAVEADDFLTPGSGRANPAPTPLSGSTPPQPPPTQPGSDYSIRRGKYAYDYQYDPATGKSKTQYQYDGRKLARDLRRKTIGGVAAGLAHYFQIDPVWVRVGLVGVVIGLPALSNGLFGNGNVLGSLGGLTVLAYVLLWIFLPGDGTLEEEKSIKKFYRNPDNKVLGGVASGLGAYFGVEASLVRIALVASVFLFGTGILAYLVLWMVAPEARSLTDKMQMAGQPITLSNIESTVKSNLNVPVAAPENSLTQLLLFPFRAVAAIFKLLGQVFGKTLGGLGSVVRVLFGVLVLVVGFSLLLSSLTILGAGVGMLPSTSFGPGNGGVPLTLLREDITGLMLLAGFVFVGLPSLALALTGLMLISRRSFINGNTVLTLLAAWVISGVVVGSGLPPLIREFSRDGKVETTEVLRPTGTPYLVLTEEENDLGFETRPRLELVGYTGTDLKLVRQASANGPTREQARTNAAEIQYRPVVADSTVTFANVFTLPDGSRFRDQELRMTLYIPYGQVFRLSEDLARYVTNRFDNDELNGMPSHLWRFTPTGLTGVGFNRTLDEGNGNQSSNTSDDDDDADDVDVDTDGQETQSLLTGPVANTLTPGTVSLAGHFGVRFQEGNTLKVMADGNREDLDKLTLTNEAGVLRIEQRNADQNANRVGLTISLPGLRVLRLSGQTNARLTEFDTLDSLTLDLSGNCNAFVRTEATALKTDQTGNSSLILRGKANGLMASLSGSSRLQASQLRLSQADVSAAGASRARLGRVKNLTKKTTGISRVETESGE